VSEDTPELSPDEMAAWLHLTGVVMTLPAAIDAQLKRSAAINFFEYVIMMSLSRSPGHAMQLCGLAQLSFGSPSRLSHALTRLEKQGWVERRSAGKGMHTVEAVLTGAGLAKLAEATPGHVREIRRLVFDVLSPAQRGQLEEVSRRLLATAAPGAIPFVCQALAEPAQP
jgi:DNA-binding MarR family transcriptional regulator